MTSNWVAIVFLLAFILSVIFFFKEGYSGIVKKSIRNFKFLLPFWAHKFYPSRIYGERAMFLGFLYIFFGIWLASIVIKMASALFSGWSQ